MKHGGVIMRSRGNIALFTKGFLQVYFIVINTYMVAFGSVLGVFVTSFAASWVWSLNVKSVAAGDANTRMIYSTGAAVGSVLALYSGALLLKLLDIVF